MSRSIVHFVSDVLFSQWRRRRVFDALASHSFRGARLWLCRASGGDSSERHVRLFLDCGSESMAVVLVEADASRLAFDILRLVDPALCAHHVLNLESYLLAQRDSSAEPF